MRAAEPRASRLAEIAAGSLLPLQPFLARRLKGHGQIRPAPLAEIQSHLQIEPGPDHLPLERSLASITLAAAMIRAEASVASADVQPRSRSTRWNSCIAMDN